MNRAHTAGCLAVAALAALQIAVYHAGVAEVFATVWDIPRHASFTGYVAQFWPLLVPALAVVPLAFLGVAVRFRAPTLESPLSDAGFLVCCLLFPAVLGCTCWLARHDAFATFADWLPDQDHTLLRGSWLALGTQLEPVHRVSWGSQAALLAVAITASTATLRRAPSAIDHRRLRLWTLTGAGIVVLVGTAVIAYDATFIVAGIRSRALGASRFPLESQLGWWWFFCFGAALAIAPTALLSLASHRSPFALRDPWVVLCGLSCAASIGLASLRGGRDLIRPGPEPSSVPQVSWLVLVPPLGITLALILVGARRRAHALPGARRNVPDSRRSRNVAIAASGVVALCAGTLWIAWPREVTHRFVPGPQGSVVHFEAVAHRRVSGYGPAQPYGIWGRRYSWDPIESTATICTDLEVGSWYPLPLRPESPAVLGPGYISVDGQGNVDLRSGERVVVRLPLRIDPAHLPETYDRDETAGGRIARNSDTGTQVTVFGAVEVVADSKVNSLAWDPDAAGRFTRFWERTTTEALGRYRPPFTFDRVDYRTRNWNPMLKTFEPAWSTAGFLYRQSDEIVGVYWPDLVHCTPAGGPVLRFRHVFGTVSGGALTELTAIDDIGQRWRIGEVERFVCFMPNGSTLFDDVTVGQDGPADWLRYFIHGLSNILRPGHPAPVRIQ